LVHFFRFWYHVPTIIWQPWNRQILWAVVLSEKLVQKIFFWLGFVQNTTRYGKVVVSPASGTQDRGFESLKSMGILYLHTYQCR
jgi:hypothetical protein